MAAPWDEAPSAVIRGVQGGERWTIVNGRRASTSSPSTARPTSCSSCAEVLTDEGYAVTTSDFEPRAFTRIVMRHPDALIIDLAPGESVGWDLLRRLFLEAKTTDIPVLVTSTSPELLEQALEEAARYGTNRSFLTKPMDLDELVRAIREMVGDA